MSCWSGRSGSRPGTCPGRVLGPGEDPLRVTRALMALDGQGDVDLAVEAQVGATVVVRASRWHPSQPSAQVHVEHLAGLQMADPLIKSWLLATRTRRPEHLEVGIGVRARQIASEHGHAVVQPAHVLEALHQIDPSTAARVFPETMLAGPGRGARPATGGLDLHAGRLRRRARLPGHQGRRGYLLRPGPAVRPATPDRAERGRALVEHLVAAAEHLRAITTAGPPPYPRLRRPPPERASRRPPGSQHRRTRFAHSVAELGWARLLEPGTTRGRWPRATPPSMRSCAPWPPPEMPPPSPPVPRAVGRSTPRPTAGRPPRPGRLSRPTGRSARGRGLRV